jgi:Ni/Fe-hydrogenase subunit HybB-like protein
MRVLFFTVVSVGLVFTGIRLFQGLGAVTNLSDRYPWGLWKAFSVLAGVAMGGAGFTMMAAVYVFHADRFKPIIRPTVVLAFLAYVTAAASLVIDIGRPWAIWHPIVYWNTHSVLFDVAWCLMLYTCVLLLEGSGLLFEKLGWHRAEKIQHAITVPIVIVGVILSTLHQSSLGSLFLIVPGKLHSIWYSSMLPVHFYVSAIALGISMVVAMSHYSRRMYGQRLEVPLLADLCRVLVGILGVYGAIRLFDLLHRGQLATAFGWSYEAIMFQAEFAVGTVVPILLLRSPTARRNVRNQLAATICVIGGFMANRLNVSITGLEGAQGGHYVPSIPEASVTLMFIALAFGAFSLAVKHLPVYPKPPTVPDTFPPELEPKATGAREEDTVHA